MGMNSLIHKILAEIGLKPERFTLQWASAAEAPRFVKLITDFTARVKALGPLGAAEGLSPDDLNKRLAEALALLSSKKLRISYGNAAKAIRKDGIFTQDHIDTVVIDKVSKAIEGGLTG